jgi:hypothetical protein
MPISSKLLFEIPMEERIFIGNTGDAFRGATWVSLHNGGGVGWGEVMNGGFGLVSTVSQELYSIKQSMSILFPSKSKDVVITVETCVPKVGKRSRATHMFDN